MESSSGNGRSASRTDKDKGDQRDNRGGGTSPGQSGALDGSLDRDGTDGALDGVGGAAGSGGCASAAGGLNSRDGRRTWTDAESDRLREVVEHSNGEPGGGVSSEFKDDDLVFDDGVGGGGDDDDDGGDAVAGEVVKFCHVHGAPDPDVC